jgi:uncharacterized protein YjbI with pentapeptide repeats
LKKKTRTIHTPDLPEDLESMDTLQNDELEDEGSYEFGRIETSIGKKNAKNVQFSEVYLKGVNFEELHLPFSSWGDVIFEKCDLSNVKFNGARFNRVEFRECKLVGTDFDEAVMRDVHFIECPAPYSLFNLMELRDVRFEECLLKEANFIGTTLDNVFFGKSIIQEVQFSDTSLKNIDLSQCQFDFIHVKEDDLRGAIISPEQAVSLIEVFGLIVKYD